MQVRIAEGAESIAAIADDCQKDLGYLGITGFQFGCVMQTLSRFWVHGEELKEWHNERWGVPKGSKGVANPALLTINPQP